MQNKSSDLRQLALEVSKSFDILSIACYKFEETVRQRFDEEECEGCKDVLNDLLGGMTIIKPTLHALARTFQFFNFDQAALQALVSNHVETQQTEENQQN